MATIEERQERAGIARRAARDHYARMTDELTEVVLEGIDIGQRKADIARRVGMTRQGIEDLLARHARGKS